MNDSVNTTRLNSNEATRFAQALSEPPRINPRLQRAIQRQHRR